MVIYESATGCVNVVVRGWVSGCKGDGGDGGHLRRRGRVSESERKERCGAEGYGGSNTGPGNE